MEMEDEMKNEIKNEAEDEIKVEKEDEVKDGKLDLNPRSSGRKPETQPRDHGAQSKCGGA